MDVSKLDYRLRRDLYPILRNAGYRKTDQPREFSLEIGGITSALQVWMMRKEDGWNQGLHDSVEVQVGVVYPQVPHLKDYVANPSGPFGVGSADVGGNLQRSAKYPGEGRGDQWDPALFSLDELVADVVRAVEGGFADFVRLWSDPRKAWEEMNAPYFGEDRSDVGGVYIGSDFAPDTMVMLGTHMKLAALLGYIDEEIELIRRLNELVMAELGLASAGEPYETRLKHLQRQQKD